MRLQNSPIEIPSVIPIKFVWKLLLVVSTYFTSTYQALVLSSDMDYQETKSGNVGSAFQTQL